MHNHPNEFIVPLSQCTIILLYRRNMPLSYRIIILTYRYPNPPLS